MQLAFFYLLTEFSSIQKLILFTIHIMTRLHKKLHNFIMLQKLVTKFTNFSQKQEKEKRKTM
jgi:hypothetical protein